MSSPRKRPNGRPNAPLFLRNLTLGLGDLALGLFALYLAFWIRLNVDLPWTISLLPADRLAFIVRASVLVVVTQNLLLYLFGFYDEVEPLGRMRTARRLVTAVAVQGLLLAAYFFFSLQEFPRSVLVLFEPINLVLLFLFRYGVERYRDFVPRRVAIIGRESEAGSFARRIDQYHWHGYCVAGFVAPPGVATDSNEGELDYPVLGSFDDLPDLIARGEIDSVLVAHTDDRWRTELVDRLSLAERRTEILLLPSPFDSLVGRTRFRSVHDLALVEVVSEQEWKLRNPLKRSLDVVASVLLIVLTSPLMLGVAVAVRLSSPGPVIYRQVRVGRGRREFTLVKFRTMVADAESETGPVLSPPKDPRVTAVGRVLRRLRLDELPQLLNVLRGDMSLVGPRPERPELVSQYLVSVPGYVERFVVRPGVTGLAQVNGDYHTSAENKLRFDLAYIANWSLWLDASVLFKTLKIVLSRPGS